MPKNWLPGWAFSPSACVGRSKARDLIAAAQASPVDCFVQFFLPCLIGNIIGGVSLVAAVNYAQVGLDA